MDTQAPPALAPLTTSLSKDDFRATIPEGGSIIALIEAAAFPGLCEQFDDEGVAAHCLFKGQAAVDLRDVAPYVARLPATSSILKQLLDEDDKPWAFWHKRPGIFMRSEMDGPDLVRHFRRFLRLHYDDKPFFFRFWEPLPAIAYFDAIAQDEDKWRRWFFPIGGGSIDEILVPDVEHRGFRVFEKGPIWDGSRAPKGLFSISDAEMRALADAKFYEDIAEMQRLLRRTFPEATADLNDEQLDKSLRRTVSRMGSFDIRQRDHLFRLAAWDLHANGRFEAMDPDGYLRDILAMGTGEADKVRRLADRLEELP